MLNLGVIGTDGANSGDFSLSAPVSNSLASGASTTFTITFAPAAAGVKTAAIHLSSNVTGPTNPFDINLTGTSLSYTSDTDGDGMNDGAEFDLAALGFDWQVSQAALVATLNAGANGAGLYTPSQVQALQVGVPWLAKDPASGRFMLTLGLSKSTDVSHFLPFPITAPQISINGNGELEFRFESTDNAAFFRVEAK